MAEAIERNLKLSINDQHVGDLIIDLADGKISFSPTNVNTIMDQKSIKIKTFSDTMTIGLGDIKFNGLFGNNLFKLSK